MLDALSESWCWCTTVPRSPRALGQMPTSGAPPEVSRSCGLASLPIRRQAGSGGPGRCPAVSICPSASGTGGQNLSPRSQGGVWTPGGLGPPPDSGSPQLHAWPWAAKHYSARERYVALRVLLRRWGACACWGFQPGTCIQFLSLVILTHGAVTVSRCRCLVDTYNRKTGRFPGRPVF